MRMIANSLRCQVSKSLYFDAFVFTLTNLNSCALGMYYKIKTLTMSYVTSAPAGEEAAVSGDVAVVDALGQVVLGVIERVKGLVPQRQHAVHFVHHPTLVRLHSKVAMMHEQCCE